MKRFETSISRSVSIILVAGYGIVGGCPSASAGAAEAVPSEYQRARLALEEESRPAVAVRILGPLAEAGGPLRPYVLYHLGAARLALGETEAALPLLEEASAAALAVGPRAAALRAEALRSAGRPREAASILDAVAAEAGRSGDRDAAGRAAVAAARALEDEDPRDAARRYIAVVGSRVRPPIALEAAVGLIALYHRGETGLPHRTAALDFTLVGVAEDAGDFALAIDLLKALLPRQAASERPATLMRIGRDEYRRARYRTALEVFRRVRRDHPDHDPSAVEYQIARCLDRVGRGGEAEAIYRRLLDRTDARSLRDDALWELAVHREEAGDTAGAIRRLREVATIRRSRYAASAAWRLGLLLLLGGRMEEARDAFDQAALRHPRSDHAGAAAYFRALCLERSGHSAEALEAYAACGAADGVPSYYRMLAEEAAERLRAAGRGPAEGEGRAAWRRLAPRVARGEAEAVAEARLLAYRFAGTRLARDVRAALRRAAAATSPGDDLLGRRPGLEGLLEAAARGPRRRGGETRPRLDVARALLAAGALDEAADEIRGTRGILGDRPEIRLALGTIFLEGGAYREAVREVEGILDGLEAAPDASLLPPEVARLLYPRVFLAEVEAAARAHRVDPSLVLAVIREESRFQSTVVSAAGAKGLMQLMPGTGREIARRLGRRDFVVADLDRPDRNIEFGVFYLRGLIDRFGRLDLALAAYNAGPGNAARWRRLTPDLEGAPFVERIDFQETRRYVKRVLGSYWAYRRLGEDADSP